MEHQQSDIFKEPDLIEDKRNIPLSIVAGLLILYLLYIIAYAALSYITTAGVLWRAGYLPGIAWIMPVLLLVSTYVLVRSIVALIGKDHGQAILISIGGIVLFYVASMCMAYL
jgi:hypothetical protein